MANTGAMNLNVTATTASASTSNVKVCYGIKLLLNLGSVPVYYNLDKPVDVSGKDYHILPAGSSIEDWDVTFSNFYCSTASGTADVHITGNSNNLNS